MENCINDFKPTMRQISEVREELRSNVRTATNEVELFYAELELEQFEGDFRESRTDKD